jgi:hypothetical protein
VQKPTQALKSVKGPGNTSVTGIARAFNGRKCLGGFLHLKPTVGFQISTLIFDFFYGGGVSLPSIKKKSNIKVDI